MGPGYTPFSIHRGPSTETFMLKNIMKKHVELVLGFLHVRFRDIRQYFLSFTFSTASVVSWVKLGAIQFASCVLSYNE